MNSSYHAALQIFQKDPTFLVALLSDLNGRMKESRERCWGTVSHRGKSVFGDSPE